MSVGLLVAAGLTAAFPLVGAAPRTQAPAPAQSSLVDLMTDDGVAHFKSQWRYSDVTIVDVTSAETDKTIANWTEAQMKGGGGYRPMPAPPQRMTYDIRPKAGAADFDDSSWEVIAPKTLNEYRSGGQLCFGWYRITLTMPEKVGGLATAGTKAFLNVNADDYGEVWVNGRLPRTLRGPNPHVIGGWNSTMRVPLTESVKPGEKIQVAIFAINGPISDTPTNRLFLRAAAVEFVR
jgi:gluconolactonase